MKSGIETQRNPFHYNASTPFPYYNFEELAKCGGTALTVKVNDTFKF